jgi:hypothetical protein
VASEILEKLPRKYRVAIGDLGSLSEEIGRGVGGVVYRTRFREADVAVKMIESSNNTTRCASFSRRRCCCSTCRRTRT